MFKTRQYDNSSKGSLAVSTETLAEMLDCGLVTARKVGEAANAKIQIGRRVLWNTEKIKKYINYPELKLIDWKNAAILL